ncbi:hypothetical protein THMIRHAS_17160 [Thiosulfatimonas sediminis]|uniref:Uncharacterized protein n=1 Tax=Thiosulfatimonas sediminis TaxID=2675054 RepID=A0A6F8PW23_9GAMM|nr:hypothetical protein [Thiosulfatimonas sediminis]BBP46343.1 hypothetical protein THMIRHAS_17160 [Thiosulfatimonas sediminis]
MIKFVTDVRPGEKDILTPVKHEKLKVTDLDGRLVVVVESPVEGWSDELLWRWSEMLKQVTENGADAYLGDVWVGSTEV